MINRNLIGYRKIIGLTQIEMADKIGLAETTYCQKERGQRDFKQTEMENIMKVIKAAGHDAAMNYIFFRS